MADLPDQGLLVTICKGPRNHVPGTLFCLSGGLRKFFPKNLKFPLTFHLLEGVC